MRQTGYIPGFSRGSIRINAYSRNTFDLIGQLRDWMRVGGDRILGIRGIGGVFWKKKLHRCEKDICSKPGWTFQRSNVLTVLAFLRLTFIKRSSVLERLKRKAVRYGMRLNYSGRRNERFDTVSVIYQNSIPRCRIAIRPIFVTERGMIFMVYSFGGRKKESFFKNNSTNDRFVIFVSSFNELFLINNSFLWYNFWYNWKFEFSLLCFNNFLFDYVSSLNNFYNL